MSQNQMILNHLKKFGSITPLDAIELYRCLRLSARIADLRAKGAKIITQQEKSKNRFGKTVCYARYILEQ